MSSLSFFTPVITSNRILNFSENLFQTHGKVAYTSPCECNLPRGVYLGDSRPSRLTSTLKVALYVYPLFYYNLPPSIPTPLKAVPLITLALLAAVKVVHRTFVSYHICDTNVRYDTTAVPPFFLKISKSPSSPQSCTMQKQH